MNRDPAGLRPDEAMGCGEVVLWSIAILAGLAVLARWLG